MLSHRVREFSGVTFSWCYKHDLFSQDELTKILDYCETLERRDGAIADGVVNKQVRKNEVAWVQRNEQSVWFFDKISVEIDWLNKQFYNYDLWGYDVLQYGKYSSRSKGRYGYHMDVALGAYNEGLSHARKLSATLLLNDDFQGGEFQLNLSNETEPVVPELHAGSLIVFPSFLLHQVTRVTKGVRHSLVAWAVGPKFR